MHETDVVPQNDFLSENPQVKKAISLMLEKKAQDVVIFDMREFTQLFDFVIIASGLSTTQIDVVCRNLEKGLKETGARPLGIEGASDSGWMLLDYVDFVVHVFSEEKRKYYRLEQLWGDMPSIKIEEDAEV